MKNHIRVFQPLFCPNDIFVWNFDAINECLEPQFSEHGSNAKVIEVNVFKMFVDFVECCFMDGKLHHI